MNCSYFNPMVIQNDTLVPLSQDVNPSNNINFAFASSTCTTNSADTSTIQVYNGFTWGSIVQSVFLFLIFMAITYFMLMSAIKIDHRDK